MGGGAARLAGTIVAAALNNAPLSAARLVLPLVALNMGLGPAYVGSMAALFSITPMLFSAAFGRWVDRRGALVPFLFSSGLILLAGPVFLVFPNRYALLAVATLIGAGSLFSHLAATCAVADFPDHDTRTRNIAYMIATYSLFQFIGPMTAGSTFEHLGNHAAIVAIVGFSLLALAVVASRFHLFVNARRAVAPDTPRGRAFRLLMAPNLRNKVLVSGMIACTMTLFPVIVSLHSVAVGITPTQAGLVLGGFSGGTLASRAGIPLASRVLRPQTLLLLSFVIGGLLLALFPLFRSFWPLAVLSGLLGLNLGIGTPVAQSLIFAVAPPDRVSEIVGLNLSVTTFLQTAAPLALGFVDGGLGIAPMVWAVSLAMFAVAAVALRPRRPSRELEDCE